MALSVTIFTNRINDELGLILGNSTADTTSSLIRDAVATFLRKMDNPEIPANLTVTTALTPYSIPATIEKISEIYDNSTPPVPVVYSLDEVKRIITFQDTPTAGTYTVYGTPASLRTNLSAIVALINENHEDIIWQYIRAYACRKAGDINGFAGELKAADKLLTEARESKNRNMGQYGQSVVFVDSTGRIFADSENIEGRDVSENNYLESDL